MPDASLNPTSLVVVAIASAFALSCVLYIAWDISGGHVNPAVTFAMAVGGHVSVPTAIFYWVAQLIASVMACLVLRVIVVGMVCFSSFTHIPLLLYLFNFFNQEIEHKDYQNGVKTYYILLKNDTLTTLFQHTILFLCLKFQFLYKITKIFFFISSIRNCLLE